MSYTNLKEFRNDALKLDAENRTKKLCNNIRLLNRLSRVSDYYILPYKLEFTIFENEPTIF